MSALTRIAWIIAASMIATACGSVRPLMYDGPSDKGEIVWLGNLVAAPEKAPLHIIYVHGIRAEGPGFSAPFREALCARLLEPCDKTKASEHYPLKVGSRPKAANYVGAQVWDDDLAWKASTPFVDRYAYTSRSGRPVVIDEVNWWPLAFPLKCRFLLAPEARLAGPDKTRLKLCANDSEEARKRGGQYYPWISQEDLSQLLAAKPIAGPTPLGNRALKQEIMDWGLSDAVVALGPMRHYLRAAINDAFRYAGEDSQAQFVVVSESLGSFIVMDAYNDPEPDSQATAEVLSKTTDLYFFANQFALLQLARIEGLPDSPGFLPDPDHPRTPEVRIPALERWAAPARIDGKSLVEPARRQLVAFSDPSDALTYYVPSLKAGQGASTVKVLNVYDRNATHWFGLIEDPAAAHVGHSRNKQVLDQLLDTRPPGQPAAR